ncbi:hypothetical protein CHQ84_08690 [Francisella noatunensis subsp. orientalis]|uniref:Uncharacterized protein n=3 Tax=Francisella orientalis TaxID=299583 RepID=A0AAP6X8L7_9GAMM|nr:hypothetical protein [Francisella orientalis]AFJ43994.1 NADH dehydrogenase subunit 6 [Francisella orientalis str. Toba 04]AKN85836.1 hypothetical protein FNO12_1246 [Francisella orientalis FNO12]AHB98594.1 NADH dehydrogenase [Francisella orientalis LADL 07-285A]AKN87375.1 Hypothetical protein FNO24_1248 [Francisella orientalis FNO24]AKN88912.1 Hypothetical protein FNO190_1246 [Francisella orientalis]
MLKKILKIKRMLKSFQNYEERFNKIDLALGRIESRQCRTLNSKDIGDNEFKVFSQWGEDGVIRFLIDNIDIKEKTFIEFGVKNYTESNTRFLLQNNNWRGLVIDGSEENISNIKNDSIYWKHNIKAECTFITKDNINQLITKNGIHGEIGILSVDIDGNDYWIWEAIDCISPGIVICEYNSHFGDTYKVSVPYDAKFVRNTKHYSNIYYGASISALDFLAKKKGYSLIGSNLAGNNVFFVRDDLVSKFNVLTPEEAYKQFQFREAKDDGGKLTFSSIEENLKIISSLDIVDVETGKFSKIKDLL